VTSSPSPLPGSLELLAKTKFGTHSAAEEWLVRNTPLGKKAVCGANDDDADPGNDPQQANAWGRARQVRADLLVWLCTDEQARQHVRWHGIQLYGADLTGRIDLSSAQIPFPLVILRCRLSEGLDLSGASASAIDLTGSLVNGIAADGVEVVSDVSLGSHFAGVGAVRLLGARIGGDLNCSGGTFTNPPVKDVKASGKALFADGVDVKGSIFLSDDFKARGEVRLLGAKVGGNLECIKGTFNNPPDLEIFGSGIALNADGINVKGSVFLRDIVANGEVRFPGSEIDGDFDCRNATFNNPEAHAEKNAKALNGKRLVVKGAVFLNLNFCASGVVDLASAQISGPLECREGKFENATVDLTDASSGPLIDSGCEWTQPGKLYLDGFSYRRIANDEPINVGQRLKWLGLQPVRSFHPRPYLQVAKVLRESGDEAGGLKVLEKMEDRRSAAEHRTLPRIWSWILKITIGYGYYPKRAIWALIVLCGAGWLLYSNGYRARTMVPTEKGAYDDFKMWGLVPDHYPQFSPLIFSLENTLPFVKLGQSDKWQPEPSGQDPGQLRPETGSRCSFADSPAFLTWFLRGQILLGWVLATLFVAGVSGVVRKE
jgi:hypothetical protein